MTTKITKKQAVALFSLGAELDVVEECGGAAHGAEYLLGRLTVIARAAFDAFADTEIDETED